MQLNSILSEQVVYDEIALLNTRLQTDCQVHAATYGLKSKGFSSCRFMVFTGEEIENYL